jgi:GT2 family glycosyltransferase
METKDLKISIIIPNLNGEELLRKNLPYILKAKENTENQIYEVVVVDDGSKDKSVDLLKNSFPWVKIIKHKINRGFSATVNMGVRMAKGDLVVLLNNDILPEEDFLVSTIGHFTDSKLFGVSLHEKDYSWAKAAFRNGYLAHEPGKETEDAHISFWVSGGSGVFRRSQWIALGGMDEKLFTPFYWEDIDLCYRAAKRGLMLLWEPKAMVTHKHESTIGTLKKSYVQKIQERNELFFLWKNITSQNMIRKHVGGLFLRLLKHPGYIRIVVMALFKLKTILGKRRQERKESKVSDEIIFSRFK